MHDFHKVSEAGYLIFLGARGLTLWLTPFDATVQ